MKLESTLNIPLQEASLDIWDKKYCLHDSNNVAIDADVDASHHRVAKSLSAVEKTPQLRALWYKHYRDAMDMGATPAGRIMSNAGAEAYKPAVSLINCTVSKTIEDDMYDIFYAQMEAAMTLKAGCGIGYEFSTLRPSGSFVAGAGATTNGPLAFMDVYDKACFTVSSAGGRRGAQMATFDIQHPDVEQFIKAKREDGRFRQFNLSLLITDEFVEAVKSDSEWQYRWKGEPVGKPVRAKWLWETIMRSNYNFAEPGFLLIDRINQFNNLWFCEHLRATNPCGEQPLPPYGSCLLGSINLTKFISNPFTEKASFDFVAFHHVIRTFTRMLDNVVELNGLPLEKQRHEITHKRRHGMGFLGLGSALAMLRTSYGSAEAVAFTEAVSRDIAMQGFIAGAELSLEKGEAPVLRDVYNSASLVPHLKYNSNFTVTKNKKTISGRELFLASHYFDAFREDSEGQDVLKLLEKHGSRFSHHSSIAPTGTIALSFGNNCSNGIEPSFGHSYRRNVIRQGKNAKESIEVCSFEYLAYRELINPNARPQRLAEGDEDDGNFLPDYFADTDSLTPEQHIDIQAAAQKWVDSSISKTINVPTNISFEAFMDTYMYAYEKKLKGCTTFRFNPENFQGVLVKTEDLKSTTYRFTLEDGSHVDLPGDAMIEYEGQIQTAANLYDAIKEGYFGKF